jgi:itaconyl-CoA hydratase
MSKTADRSFAVVPSKQRGTKYEDHVIGKTFRHHWGRTVTEADNVLFCTATLSYNPAYFNVDIARELGFPTCLINPLLVLLIAIGLSVEDLSENSEAFLGLDEVRFGSPMHAGDTVYAESEVIERRLSSSRIGSGIVTWRTRATNQMGAEVVQFKRSNLLAVESQSTKKVEEANVT